MRRAAAFLLVSILAFAGVAGCLSDGKGATTMPTRSQLLLWSSPDPILVLQLDFEKGTQPDPRALEWVMDNLRQVTHKRDIRVEMRELSDEPSNAGRNWSMGDLWKKHVTSYALENPALVDTNGTAYIHVLYLLGKFDDTSIGEAAGLAVTNAVWIFPQSFVTRANGLLAPTNKDPTDYELGVLLHEVGHVLGLVNNGAPMVRAHEHAKYRHHSSNPDSVMFEGVEGGPDAAARWFEDHGTIYPIKFDADDLADLAAVRDAEPRR